MIDVPSTDIEAGLLKARLKDLLSDPDRARAATTVIVPSLTVHPDELRKFPGAVHFEQRLLFAVARLTVPQARVVYVTSRPIDPEIVAYTVTAIPGLSGLDLTERLVLLDCADLDCADLDCADDTPRPLTEKILRSPELIEQIRRAVPDPAAAYLVTYNSTPAERDLALRIGIPLYSCDPDLQKIGTKSRGRQLFRSTGVATPAGFEDLHSEDALVDALAAMKRADLGLRRAVVKLNESFAGAGNAVFTFSSTEAPDTPDLIAQKLRHEVRPPGDDWSGFRQKLTAMGAIVEEFISTEGLRSPSAQLLIHPDGTVRVTSTHDQILGGADDQTFIGCCFPAHHSYRARVRDAAHVIGRELAGQGVIGHLSIDFLADALDPDTPVTALEINLRIGGATAPFHFMDAVVAGVHDSVSGDYRARDGSSRAYAASDRVQVPGLRGATVKELVSTAVSAGVHYDPDTQTGTLFFALGGLAEFGRFGLVAIGRSPQEALDFYDRTLAAVRE